MLANSGALMASTGKFTARAPKERDIVNDHLTENLIWWGDTNLPISSESFDSIHQKMEAHLLSQKVYVPDAYVGADPEFQVSLRIINTLAWHNLFCYNMFLRPRVDQTEIVDPDYTILCVPEFEAELKTDGTRESNFAF